MRSKKRRKSRKQSETKPRSQETVKTISEAKPAKTIKQVVIESITAHRLITNDEMIAAVKVQFPKSAFDARHASWYRSQARKGLLTRTPISIPSQSKRIDAQSE